MVREDTKRMRKKFLRYSEAEYIYSIKHRKLMELADEAGAIYRVDGYALIDRDKFEEWLERYREPTGTLADGKKRRKGES